MKKIIVLILALLLAVGCFAGCGGNDNGGSSSETVVDVKVYKAGYGTEWLKSAIEKFNNLYSSKGYKVKIIEESSNVSESSVLEIKDVAHNDTDLYFINGADIADYLESSGGIMDAGELLIEDLNDVFSSKAIKFDGSTENTTIESKLHSANKPFYQYNGSGSSQYASYTGNYYAFPWASGAGGLFVNKNLLNSFNLTVPNTTDELIAQYQKVAPNGSPVRSGIYPMTFAGGNAMGYWLYMFDTLFAQYSGVDAENDFWQLTGATDGYKVYQDEGILQSLKIIEKVIDDDYCKNGSALFSNEQSQKELLNGNALYMCTGNWVYNEMKLNYSSLVDNMEMIKMPIISSLGTKLGFSSDAVLSNIVKGIDDGKTDSVIASENSVDASKVAEVRKARNIYYDASVDHVALIPSYSTSKDVAKMFLRFLASDDNLDLYKQKTNASLPFNYEGSSKVTPNAFVTSVDKVSGTTSSVMVTEQKFATTVRRYVNGFVDTPYATIFDDIAKKSKSAEQVYNYCKNTIQANWNSYLRQAGIR